MAKKPATKKKTAPRKTGKINKDGLQAGVEVTAEQHAAGVQKHKLAAKEAAIAETETAA